jgi:hypothetical protein
MARTRVAEPDPSEVVEEDFTLGPEDEPVPEIEPEVDADGNPIEPELDEDGDPIEPEPEDEIREPAPRRSGGGSQTIKAQRRARQDAETETARLRQENAELRGYQAGITQRQPADPQAAARADQEWYASLEMMPPAQAYQAIVQRERQAIGAELNQREFRANERADKQAYDATARTSKVHQQYRSQVESTLAAERAQNRNPEREVILKYLVGNDVLERANRAAPAQRTGAARRVAGQQTRPTGARGDVARTGRRPQPGTPEHDDMVVQDAIRRGESVF